MADNNWGGELPQRVPAAARAGLLSPVAPVLPEELRQRMQAAVRAERRLPPGLPGRSAQLSPCHVTR